MSLSFQRYIKDQINEDLVAAWKDTFIEKVVVDQDKKTWILHLCVQEPIASSICRETEKQLLQQFDYLQGIELVPELIDSYDSLYNLLDSRRREIAASVFTEGENLFESPALTWRQEHRIDLVCKNGAIYESIISQGICTRIADWFWHEYCLQLLVERYWLPPGSKTHGPISITWQKVNWRLSPWSRPIPLKTGK